MKYIILFLISLMYGTILAQSSDADLNGMVFRGKATEQTPPDVDRMPMVYDEYLRFIDGKIYSDLLKIYSADSCSYTSKVDDRRMIAVKVISFSSVTSGNMYGQDVNIEFSGDIFADLKLSGNLIIKYPDGSEVKFLVEGTAE